MKEFFVIGSKTSKSLSPLIFNHWFKKHKLKAKYSYIEVGEAKFDAVLTKQLQKKTTRGFNVTIPYKKKIFKHLNTKNLHAKNIGAVNCVTVGKKIKGTNTDWLGYLRSIKDVKTNKNKKILILGCGGAAQAVFYGFAKKGYKNILVFNRSKKAIEIKGIKKFTKKYSIIDKHLKDAHLIINTTPTNPLNKKQRKKISAATIISDIVYSPKETTFLKNFNENKKIYGISMLIEQAALCFYQWFGFVPKLDKKLIKKIHSKI